jgi:hypothetical protein
MSVYNNWYIAKSKKFEIKATPSEKGTLMLEINAYDVLKLDASPEQWEDIIAVLGAALAKTAARPTRPAARPTPEDDY